MDPAPSENKGNFVLVRTTLPTKPLPANDVRLSFTTDRLVMRPWRPEDFNELRKLTTQEEVMRWTRLGRVEDEAATQKRLARFLPPNDVLTHSFAITLKESGEVIGTGGTHAYAGNFGWPEIGYMFRKEFWGQGYATEFVKAYVQSWSELPRGEAEAMVDPRTVTGDGGVAEEQLIAITAETNVRSQVVLRKCGFEHFTTWPGDDDVLLPTFRFFPGRQAAP